MTHRPTVFADANILLQRVLRDYTLYADTAEVITVTWSDGVLDEMTKNLVGTRLISGDTEAERQRNADRLRSLMTDAYAYATVETEPWAVEVADGIRMDQKDKHVFAAALTARAEILLTENIKDFPTPKALAAAGLNIRIMTFGTFLIEVLLANPTVFADVHRLTVKNLRGSDDASIIRRLWGSAGQRHPAAVHSAARTLGLEAELNAEIVRRSASASGASASSSLATGDATCGIFMPRAKTQCVLAMSHRGHHRSKRPVRR